MKTGSDDRYWLNRFKQEKRAETRSKWLRTQNCEVHFWLLENLENSL